MSGRGGGVRGLSWMIFLARSVINGRPRGVKVKEGGAGGDGAAALYRRGSLARRGSGCWPCGFGGGVIDLRYTAPATAGGAAREAECWW